jgi:hypothetical protein
LGGCCRILVFLPIFGKSRLVSLIGNHFFN